MRVTWLVMLIMGLAVKAALAQTNPIIEVVLNQPTARQGDIVTADVYVRNGTNVGGLDIGIDVDAQCLRILDRQPGGYFPTTDSEGAFSAFSELNEHDTRLASALTDRTKYVNGDGVFYSVQLEVTCQQATAAVNVFYAQVSSYEDPTAQIIDVISYNLHLGTLTASNTTLAIASVIVAPVAIDDVYSTSFQTILTVDAPGVLANDMNVQGSVPISALLTSASHGIVVLNSDGGFTYTPNADFTGNDTFSYTASDGTLISNPAIATITVNPPTGGPTVSNLAVTGNLTSGVILPTFVFVLPAGSSAEWFNLVIVRTEQTVLINQWFKTGPYCVGLLCSFTLTLDLFPHGLQNGTYEWYVVIWSERDSLSEPSATGTFSILVAAPQVPQNVQVSTSTGDVITSWDDDPAAALWHIVIESTGGTTAYDKWFDRTEVVCSSIRCITLPDNSALPNGNYTIYVQAWGAGGFNNHNNSSSFSDGVAFELSSGAVGSVTGLFLTNTDSGEPTFGWVPAENSTWTLLWLGTEKNGVYATYYLGWQKVANMMCPNGRSEMCLTTLDDIFLPNGSFTWWMINWGPAGYPTDGTSNVWIKALDFVVEAPPPELAVPAQPSYTLSTDYFPFQWDHVEGITWYHLWLSDAPTVVNGKDVWADTVSHYDVWLRAREICQGGVCTITPDRLYLPDGDYRWYLETYNPGWTRPNWNIDQFGAFSIDRK